MTFQKDTKSRIVTLDIETVSLNGDPDGCFDAMNGRIACVAMLIDTGFELRPVVICDQDERKILTQFWANITDEDLLVGHNLLNFDLPYLKQRSWILGVKPSIDVNLRKYWTDDVYDVMSVWSNWAYKMKGFGLEAIAQALGLGGKTGHGSEVAELWATGQYVKLMDYCLGDVWLTYQIYCRMKFRAPLPLNLPHVALPIPAMPGDNREPVYALVQQKGPETVAAAQAPQMTLDSTARTIPQASNGNGNHRPSRRRSPRVKEIQYAEMGGALLLAGGTFDIKESLSEMGGRYEGKGKTWQVPAGKLPVLQGACASAGIRLIAANGGAA